MSDITIYHNTACGTSRNTLALIRHSGAEPRVIEYLKTLGARLCRPSESVLDLLPQPQQGPFSKEYGEVVIDENGNRV